MLPIYFHGNCNRYREHNNTVGLGKFFFFNYKMLFLQSLTLAKYFHQQETAHGAYKCSLSLSLSHTPHYCHCRYNPTCYYAHRNYLVSIQQVSMNSNGCKFFHMKKFIDTPPLHVLSCQTSFCQNAVQLRFVTSCKYGLLAGSFNLYCNATNIQF